MDTIEFDKITASLGQGVQLMAACKTQTIDKIDQIAQAGVRLFGENYVQEAIDKWNTPEGQELKTKYGLKVHLIGHLQSNKARMAAQLFDGVDALSSFKTAQQLNAACTEREPMPVLLQYNALGEESKQGLTTFAQMLHLAQAVHELPHLRLDGIMAMAPLTNDEQITLRAFKQTQELFLSLKTYLPAGLMNTLSMGMSGDYQLAVQYGSTRVRLGTMLFGARVPLAK
jgi:pyridoxal phosphate enzyme (YggS family)